MKAFYLFIQNYTTLFLDLNVKISFFLFAFRLLDHTVYISLVSLYFTSLTHFFRNLFHSRWLTPKGPCKYAWELVISLVEQSRAEQNSTAQQESMQGV